MEATPVLKDDETRVYRSCVGALMHYVLDRADARLEVSILGSNLRALTTGAMEALRTAGNERRLHQTESTEEGSRFGGTCGLLRHPVSRSRRGMAMWTQTDAQ